MKFGLAVSSDATNASVILDLSNELEDFFKDKIYGTSIKMYSIGIACVSPKFEQFFKVGKPTYTEGKKTITFDGDSIEIEDSLSYNLKLDFEKFENSSEFECGKILAIEILQSLKILEGMKGGIKDFNSGEFKVDLENFFKMKELI